ncbi:MAG: hypothetical protein AAF487_00875 [Bacteroidota bacterium]
MIKRIDILKELQVEKETTQYNLIREVKQWILDEEYFEEKIFESESEMEPIRPELFSNSEIYKLKSIKDICIKYQLRFLDQKYFKDEIPYEAIIKIKEISRQKEVDLKRFKILAPAERFSLKDPNADPILFAQISDDSFVFIHKWGNDMNWYKKWLAFPFRNLKTLLVSIFVVSMSLASIIPAEWFGLEHLGYFNFYRVFAFFWIFIVSASITSYLWFLLDKKFSSLVWDSKYF